MITNLDPASELFLANVDRIQQRLAEANRQVSSGKRIDTPSDAPDQIDSLLQLRANRQHNQQIQANLSLALTDTQTADGALTAAIKLMDRARTLAAQGATATADSATRRTLADEVQSLLDQMLSYSQTTVQGRYIFSGDREDLPAYQADSTSPTGAARLLVTSATRRIESPSGGSFAAGTTAQEIFDHRNADDTTASDNVFAALSGLKASLLADSTAAVTASTDAIQQASAHLNSVQAFYGSIQNRIQDATSFAAGYDTDLRKQVSDIEDADVAAAALEATSANTQLQAAFQMRALLPRRSLFEYLG
jgi:flagellar hook-associated protein 3 FlgL